MRDFIKKCSCGGDAISLILSFKRTVIVKCPKCGAHTKGFMYRDERDRENVIHAAIEKWNNTPFGEEQEIAYLKELAEKHGYILTRKVEAEEGEK